MEQASRKKLAQYEIMKVLRTSRRAPESLRPCGLAACCPWRLALRLRFAPALALVLPGRLRNKHWKLRGKNPPPRGGKRPPRRAPQASWAPGRPQVATKAAASAWTSWAAAEPSSSKTCFFPRAACSVAGFGGAAPCWIHHAFFFQIYSNKCRSVRGNDSNNTAKPKNERCFKVKP